jgi:hypothetical protein
MDVAKIASGKQTRGKHNKGEELTVSPAAVSEAEEPLGPDVTGEPLGPITDPPLAAFEIGRLLNRLAFHLQHAWFLADGYHESEVKAVAGRLGLRARVLALEDRRSDLQTFIRDTVERLWRQYESEQHPDWVEGELDALDRRCYQDADAREVVLQTVFTSLSSIRQAIRQHLDGQVALAFQLGELVDQGVCPRNIYRHLDYRSPAPTSGAAQCGFGAHRPFQPPPSPRYGSRRPGDLLPWPDWAGDVQHVWAELGMPVLPPAALEISSASALTLEEEADARVEMVEGLAGLAREGLRQLATPSPATRPAVDQEATRITDEYQEALAHGAERLTIDPDTFSVTLDGKTYTVEHPGAFHFFKMIADARGQLVSQETLRQAMACKGRLDKLRTHLPKALNSLIKSRPGNGGGYWLQLPEKTRP